MLKEEKTSIIQQYATHEGDTGSPEVQIAVLRRSTKLETEPSGAFQNAAALLSWPLVFRLPRSAPSI